MLAAAPPPPPPAPRPVVPLTTGLPSHPCAIHARFTTVTRAAAAETGATTPAADNSTPETPWDALGLDDRVTVS